MPVRLPWRRLRQREIGGVDGAFLGAGKNVHNAAQRLGLAQQWKKTLDHAHARVVRKRPDRAKPLRCLGRHVECTLREDKQMDGLFGIADLIACHIHLLHAAQIGNHRDVLAIRIGLLQQSHHGFALFLVAAHHVNTRRMRIPGQCKHRRMADTRSGTCKDCHHVRRQLLGNTPVRRKHFLDLDHGGRWQRDGLEPRTSLSQPPPPRRLPTRAVGGRRHGRYVPVSRHRAIRVEYGREYAAMKHALSSRFPLHSP